MDTQEEAPSSSPKIISQNQEPRVYDVNQPEESKKSPVLARPIILGDLTLGSPTTFTTIGANGGASALTALPVGYIVVVIGNVSYQMPYYNLA